MFFLLFYFHSLFTSLNLGVEQLSRVKSARLEEIYNRETDLCNLLKQVNEIDIARQNIETEHNNTMERIESEVIIFSLLVCTLKLTFSDCKYARKI